MKNCGDYIHFQIAEKNIPAEMVKIVKKKVTVVARSCFHLTCTVLLIGMLLTVLLPASGN